MLLDLSEVVEDVRLRLGLGRRHALLEAALRADLPALRDLAADVAREARHLVHGLLDPEPALPRARVGDARRDLGRPDDPRHRDGQSGGGRPPRVRGARARLRRRGALFEEGLAVLRRCGRRADVTFHGEFFDYDDVSFFSGTEMGPLMPVQTAAADLGRLEPAAQGRRPAGRDRAPARGRVPPHRQLRRRLADVLPRAAPRGARRAARRDRAATPTSTAPTSRGS